MKRPRLALLALGAAALATAPHAADPPAFLGEQLVWDVHYAGMNVATAWANATPSGGAVVLDGGTKTASWYASVYAVDDHITSTWIPGQGSAHYVTHFREGDFHQDQDMRLAASGNSVTRKQETDGTWKTTNKSYPAAGAAEDPFSAMYALRLATGSGPWTWQVFSGRKTQSLQATPLGVQQLKTLFGEIPTDTFSLSMGKKGGLQGAKRFVVYLSQDAARLPVRAEISTDVGTVRADLAGYRAPDGKTWGTVSSP